MSPQRDATRSAMWALTHPLRLRMFELLAAGPSTGSRLAALVGESRASTTSPLRALDRTGAIVEDVALGTRRERWWRRAEDFVVWPTPPDVEARANHAADDGASLRARRTGPAPFRHRAGERRVGARRARRQLVRRA